MIGTGRGNNWPGPSWGAPAPHHRICVDFLAAVPILQFLCIPCVLINLYYRRLSSGRVLAPRAAANQGAYVVAMLSGARSSSHRLALPLFDAVRVAAAARCLLGEAPAAAATAALSAALAAEPAPVWPPQQVQQNQRQDRQQQQQEQQQEQPAAATAKMERKPLAPPGYSRTFYKRQLPSPPAIEFASDRGKAGGSHVLPCITSAQPPGNEGRMCLVLALAPFQPAAALPPLVPGTRCRCSARAATLGAPSVHALSGLGLSSRGTSTCNCMAPKAPSLSWVSPAVSPASAGKQVFAEALAAGTMNNFFKLIEQFRTQVGRRVHETVWPGLGAAV